MVDYSVEEYEALQAVFPPADKFLCAFHREQSWRRWVVNCKYKIIQLNNYVRYFLTIYMYVESLHFTNFQNKIAQ